MLSAVDVSASLLAELRKLTGASFTELKTCIARRQPVLMLPLFDNDFYASGAARLHAVVRLLESTGTDFAIYELAEGERLETRDEALSRITPEVLKNVLHGAHR